MPTTHSATIHSANSRTPTPTKPAPNPQRTFLVTEAVVTAGAATGVLVADVELELPAFEVTAARIIAHAVGLVIIRGGFVFQIQIPGSGIALSIRRDPSARCAATGLAKSEHRWLGCMFSMVPRRRQQIREHTHKQRLAHAYAKGAWPQAQRHTTTPDICCGLFITHRVTQTHIQTTYHRSCKTTTTHTHTAFE